MKKIMHQEWNGTTIDIINTLKRVELKVDGKTQDYFEGSQVPAGKSVSLEARGNKGAKVRVVFNRSMFVFTRYTIFYNERKIKSGLVK